MAKFRLHFTQSFGNIIEVDAERLSAEVLDKAVRDYLNAQVWDEDGALVLYSAEDESGNAVAVSGETLAFCALERGAYLEAK